MDITAPLLNGAMLALFTLILAWLGKARFDALERRIDRLEASVDRRFEAVDRRLDSLAADIAQLRSDLLQVVLAERPEPRPQTG